MKGYEYKRFTHTEVFRESSAFDPEIYVRKVCSAGWRPFDIVEGRGESAKVDGDGTPIRIYYLVVQATREIEVESYGPEPESVG